MGMQVFQTGEWIEIMAETVTRALGFHRLRYCQGIHPKSSGTLRDRGPLPITEQQLYQKCL